MTYLYWMRECAGARGHLPVGALDPVHLDALGGRPVAEEVVSADEAHVIAEVSIAVDVEGDGDGGRGGGAGIFSQYVSSGSGSSSSSSSASASFFCLSLRLGVLRQRLELGGGLGERRALCGGLRGGGDRGGVRGIVRAGVARGDGSEGRHRATRPAMGRGECAAPGGDEARRGGAPRGRLRR